MHLKRKINLTKFGSNNPLISKYIVLNWSKILKMD